MDLRLTAPSLVVLAGPSGSGKSHWAREQFADGQVVSSDRLRAQVGEGEHDQRASADAFALLDEIVERRLKRGLLTVVDATSLEAERRQHYRDAAARHGVDCVVVAFDTDAATCRKRNAARAEPVPAKVLSSQLKAWTDVRAALADEGYAAVHAPGPVRVVPRSLGRPASAESARRPLRFGLQLPRHGWPGGPEETAARLREMAVAAEEVGVTSLWVMDHFIQIPQAGRAWDDLLEGYGALHFLAACTSRVQLGTLVTGITYRNIAHLAKVIATLDVLSGGRAVAGLGAAWFEHEHVAYGIRFPPVAERFAMLEDALELLPLMWGPGSPAFEGRTITVAEAVCYPRPIQSPRPRILVGGSGEKNTLRLVAQYADACNLFGDAATVARKVDVLHRHCVEIGRAPEEIEVTHLGTVLVGADPGAVGAAVARLKPPKASEERFAAAANAGTVEDHLGRFDQLSGAGVETAIVNLPGAAVADDVLALAPLIDAYR